jgi:hypothetical protein
LASALAVYLVRRYSVRPLPGRHHRGGCRDTASRGSRTSSRRISRTMSRSSNWLASRA